MRKIAIHVVGHRLADWCISGLARESFDYCESVKPGHSSCVLYGRINEYSYEGWLVDVWKGVPLPAPPLGVHFNCFDLARLAYYA